MALTALGDAIAVVAMTVMMKVFGWDWKICFSIAIVFFLAISITTYLGTDEVPMGE